MEQEPRITSDPVRTIINVLMPRLLAEEDEEVDGDGIEGAAEGEEGAAEGEEGGEE
jgi:hypothetical protein